MRAGCQNHIGVGSVCDPEALDGRGCFGPAVGDVPGGADWRFVAHHLLHEAKVVGPLVQACAEPVARLVHGGVDAQPVEERVPVVAYLGGRHGLAGSFADEQVPGSGHRQGDEGGVDVGVERHEPVLGPFSVGDDERLGVGVEHVVSCQSGDFEAAEPLVGGEENHGPELAVGHVDGQGEVGVADRPGDEFAQPGPDDAGGRVVDGVVVVDRPLVEAVEVADPGVAGSMPELFAVKEPLHVILTDRE